MKDINKHISSIINKETIEYLKNNKQEITDNLLILLRTFGNEGKQIALDILDIEKDNEQYYLDAFGNRMSFNGNRRLKKAYSKINLSPIHISEIKKCKNDIHYFKDNYVKIKTKKGINFPDLRQYQNDFIEEIIPDENESIVGLMGRQSGKSVTTAIYLAHKYNFDKDINIGIVGNKGPQAREFLSNTKNIIIELPIWLQQGTIVWNKGSIENEMGMRILTDVPSSDSFRGFTIALLVCDEVGFIRSSRWEDFADSIFPSQSALAWKKNIILSTANGMNHFYEIVKGAREKTNGYKIFEVDWRNVPRYNSNGDQKSPDEFMNEIIKKHGIIYFNQNYANEFVGSSYTLISSSKLKKLQHANIEEIRDQKLKIYYYPQKNHRYIMSVDAAKDGTDNFAIQIVDITDFNFIQCATAKLQIDYLLMPEFINEWCEFYNNPYLIIENNEGAGQSIADQLYQTYEYENLHFDKDIGRNKRKKFPGFRTTTKTRKQILQTLKLFIENDKLEINDKDTINELMQFILINNKYQADEGAHDDTVMSLAIIFAPFCNIKNFEDMKAIVSGLYRNTDNFQDEEIQNLNRENVGFSDLLVIGCFDDGTDEEYLDKKYIQTSNGYIIEETF